MPETITVFENNEEGIYGVVLENGRASVGLNCA